MVKHGIRVQGIDMQGTAQSRPVLLQMHDRDFLPHFLQDLGHPDQTPVSSAEVVPSSDASPATLFQPVQRIVNVAMVQLNCDTLGFPPVDPTRVESAGIVIRRVFRQSAEPQAIDQIHSLPFAWMHDAGGSFNWVRLKPGQERLDPDPKKRPQLQSGWSDLDQQLTAMSLSSAMTEVFTPAFVAPPEICNSLGRTIVYGMVPTASSDLCDAKPQAPSFADPDDRQRLSDNLPPLLKTGPITAPLPDQFVTVQWLSDDFLQNQQPPLSSGDIAIFQNFSTTLRMLQNVFGAFENTPEAQKILDLLNRYVVTQNFETVDAFGAQIEIPTPVGMGDFYTAAYEALLGPHSSSATNIRMPVQWQSISAQDQNALLDLLIAAMAPQTAKVLAPQGRYQDSSRLYTLRIFLRIKPENPACPMQLVWSQPSEPFRIAAWYESGGRPHPPIVLPDPSNLRNLAKPNASFAVPAGLMNAMQGSSLSGMMKGGGGGGGITIDWICGFSIPLITICAFFVLNIFFSLLAIIFFWLPFFKICIPIPAPKKSAGD